MLTCTHDACLYVYMNKHMYTIMHNFPNETKHAWLLSNLEVNLFVNGKWRRDPPIKISILGPIPPCFMPFLAAPSYHYLFAFIQLLGTGQLGQPGLHAMQHVGMEPSPGTELAPTHRLPREEPPVSACQKKPVHAPQLHPARVNSLESITKFCFCLVLMWNLHHDEGATELIRVFLIFLLLQRG